MPRTTSKPKTYTKAEYDELKLNRDEWIKAHNNLINHWFNRKWNMVDATDIYITGILTPFVIALGLFIFWCVIHLTMWIGGPANAN